MSNDQNATTSSPNAAIDNELTTTNNTAVFKVPSKQAEMEKVEEEEEEVKDCSLNASSGFSNSKLSRQRISVHQQSPSVHLLTQNNNSQLQQMETSLIFVRNPKLTNEMLSTQPLPTATTTTSTPEALTSTVSFVPRDNSLIPPIHGPSSMAKSSLLAARPQTTGNVLTAVSSNTNTASTYAAALAAAISSRGNTERSEGLVRGPLGMPMHVLAASSSTYALPSSAPSVCLVKTSTSTPLPAPSTAPSILSAPTREAIPNQPTIPGQVVQELPFMGHTITTVPNSKATGSEPQYTSTALKFPTTSMLSSTYSGSSSTLSPSSLVGSTSFTKPPITLPTTGSKYEPELLLSPAKLGQ